MARIPLRRHGKIAAYAIVDAVDVADLVQFRWSLSSTGYAVRPRKINGRWTNEAMHRRILGLAQGDPLEGDHVNRNRIDNRRANLRIATRHQQAQNLPSAGRGYSRFRGVKLFTPNGRWIAHAKVNGRTHYGGYFATEEEAAAAASALRARLMPYSEDALKEVA